MSMVKQQSHGHRKAERSYFGEFDAVPLIDYLNWKGRPGNDPVEKLIRLDLRVGDPRAIVLGNDPSQEIRATVAAIVRRFKVAVAPVVGTVIRGSWEVDWMLVGKLPPRQGLALIRLLHTASHGLLDRIRQCAWEPCGKWFFARFPHKECCSGSHQQRRVRSTEHWKKNKREYMRRLRHQENQRERRQLELSKAKRKAGSHQQRRVRSTEHWKKNKREYMRRLRHQENQRERRQLELSKAKRKAGRK